MLFDHWLFYLRPPIPQLFTIQEQFVAMLHSLIQFWREQDEILLEEVFVILESIDICQKITLKWVS